MKKATATAGLLAALAGAAFLTTALTAQESDTKSGLKFYFASVTTPADPNPASQDEAARLTTLRKAISEAIALLEKDDLDAFFGQFMDPFWLARGAGSPNGPTTDQLYAKFIRDDPERSKHFREQFGSTLKQSLTAQPRWLLDGRAASFMSGRSSHAAEFWVYFDGKWRISPET